MAEILLGIAMVVAGLLVVIFSEQLARLQIAWNRWLLGVEFSPEWVRPSLVMFGAVLALVGLLVSLGLLPR
jgi:hypothetical protein